MPLSSACASAAQQTDCNLACASLMRPNAFSQGHKRALHSALGRTTCNCTAGSAEQPRFCRPAAAEPFNAVALTFSTRKQFRSVGLYVATLGFICCMCALYLQQVEHSERRDKHNGADQQEHDRPSNPAMAREIADRDVSPQNVCQQEPKWQQPKSPRKQIRRDLSHAQAALGTQQCSLAAHSANRLLGVQRWIG